MKLSDYNLFMPIYRCAKFRWKISKNKICHLAATQLNWIHEGRHTRDKRVRSAHPTRVSHAAGAASRADVVHMMRASYARHSSSKCDVKRAEAPGVRSGVTFGQYCMPYLVSWSHRRRTIKAVPRQSFVILPNGGTWWQSTLGLCAVTEGESAENPSLLQDGWWTKCLLFLKGI
jgi:hypothetical protein